MPTFTQVPKHPKVVTFNLDASNLFDCFKLFFLIHIFLDSFVSTKFHLPAQPAFNPSDIPGGSLAGLYWHEFFCALCKISPGLMFEDLEPVSVKWPVSSSSLFSASACF